MNLISCQRARQGLKAYKNIKIVNYRSLNCLRQDKWRRINSIILDNAMTGQRLNEKFKRSR